MGINEFLIQIPLYNSTLKVFSHLLNTPSYDEVVTQVALKVRKYFLIVDPRTISYSF